jgi:hypothetical protein
MREDASQRLMWSTVICPSKEAPPGSRLPSPSRRSPEHSSRLSTTTLLGEFSEPLLVVLCDQLNGNLYLLEQRFDVGELINIIHY